MVIDIFENLRAKSDGESLKTHIENALRRVIQLSDAVQNDKILPHIEFSVLKDKEERANFFKALTKAAILHDFGKIDYEFQRKMFRGEDWGNIRKFLRPVKDAHFSRHEVLSAIWASLLLNRSDEWDEKIITAILFHHYNNYYDGLKGFPEFIYENEEKIEKYFDFVSKNETFKKSYDNLLTYLSNETFFYKDFVKDAIKELQNSEWNNINKAVDGLKKGYEEDELPGFTFFYELPDTLGEDTKDYDEEFLKFLLLLGSLRRVDYAASGDVWIEGPLDELPNFEKASKIIKEKLKVEKLWQESILRDKNLDDLKRTILIAPTGSGKTEFSILWSSKFPKKFLYTLPLRVALNDLYHRFKGVKEDGLEEKGYFSKAIGFSNDLADILHSTSFIEYLKEDGGGYTDIESKVNSTKLLSSPVLLTTPDQIFLTSLNYYGSDKVVAVYPMANIVIDEIQTYNPEMAAIIIRTLQLVKAYGGNILVMTATFPPYFKKFLEGFNEIDVSELRDVEIKNLKLKRHKIEVIEKQMFEYKEKKEKGKSKGYEIEITSDALSEIKKWLKERPRSLIVVNNVKKAILLYEKLKNDKELSLKKRENNEKENELFLLHSRIVEKYKDERIKAIKERLISNNKRVVVVATQIIEASVDFDFDSMITEISSIDSQIQRWGRVYRKRQKDYEGAPNILIFAGIEEGGKVKFDRGTSFIYDKDVLLATREVLLDTAKNKEVLDYSKEKGMVEKTFEIKIGGKKLTEKYEEEIEKTLDFLNYFTASKKSDAQRIFRKLAGINVVVPALMKEDKENWVKEFAKIVEDSENLTWDMISSQVEEKLGVKKDKWAFKQKLYEYSVDFPIFCPNTNKYYNYLNNEFKGFRIFKLKEKKKVDILKEYGLDGVLPELETNELEDFTFY